MLKSLLHDRKGVISWLLSQLALILATGILLASIASITFYSDWKKEAEIKAIASELASWIYTMDLKVEENITKFFFPLKDFYYNASISTDYIVIERYDGRFKDKIRVAYPLFIKPYVIREDLNIEWKNGEELHNYLCQEYGHKGTADDPLPSVSINTIYIEAIINKIGIGNIDIKYLIEKLEERLKELSTESIMLIKEQLKQFLETFGISTDIDFDQLINDNKKECKNYLDDMLDEIAKKLADKPLRIDINKPLIIEKCNIYFDDNTVIGIVIIYQEGENET